MGGNYIIGIPNIPLSNPDSVVNKYIDDINTELTSKVSKLSKIITYKELHFKGLKRTTVWGQESGGGFPFLPLQILNPNSKSSYHTIHFL